MNGSAGPGARSREIDAEMPATTLRLYNEVSGQMRFRHLDNAL
jgi:hypothetical protein